MKSTKTNKGITLIALIITIVVLLILAAVAISSITDDGILHYAQNAADAYNQAQRNEAGMLNGYLDYLNQLNQQTCTEHQWTGGGWDDELGVDEDGEPYGGYHPTQCSICGLICEHDGFNDWDLNEVWTANDDSTCYPSYYCKTCGMQFDNEFGYDEDHDYSGGTCTKCGNVCEEHSLNDHYDNSTDTECILTYYCDYCDYWEETTSEHDYQEGICNTCGHECGHDYEDSQCVICEYTCPHPEEAYVDLGWRYDENNGNHYSWWSCDDCGEIDRDQFSNDLCYDDNDDGFCDVCKHEM